jgi:hypothetical protein
MASSVSSHHGLIEGNDPFDILLSSLDKAYESGLVAGKEYKEHKMITEGFSAGWSKGVKMGKELGLYYGILGGIDMDKLSEKNCAKVAQLRSLILELQPLNFDNHKDMQRIRSLFKQISRNLKLPVEVKRGEECTF